MKLDWGLVKAILQALEDKPAGQEFVAVQSFPEWPRDEVGGHMKLMADAGLIEAVIRDLPGGGVVAVARDLRLEGHNLLSRLRNKSIWEPAVSMARSRGLELTFEVVKSLTLKMVEQLTQ